MRMFIVKYSRTDSVYKWDPNFVITLPADGLGARLSMASVMGEELYLFMSKFLWLLSIPYHIHEYDYVIQMVDEKYRDTEC